MKQSDILKNKLEEMEDNRLANFIVCCHVDKLLEENIPSSKYDIFIQAGAALTEKRVCDLNDHDDFEKSISKYNQRYSEMSAMYWAGEHIMTDYVGFSHYRRRLLVSDEELSNYMDEGFDIITTKECQIDNNIKDNYIGAYYKKDWDLFMELVDKYMPEDRSLMDELFNRDMLHPANINIFSANCYKEYCQWVFPLLEEFCQRSPVKFDIYQRRDVGFIGERLSSVFVEKKMRQGAKVIEVPFKDYRSSEWTPEKDCLPSEYEKILDLCRSYFLKSDISKCRRLVAMALSSGGAIDKRIYDLAIMFRAAIDEQKEYSKTMYEYLPEKWRVNLDTMLSAYQGLATIISVLRQNNSDEAMSIYREFIESTSFSPVIILSQCRNLKIEDEEFINKLLEK